MMARVMIFEPAAAAAADGDEYEAVEGLDRTAIECQRSFEAVAAKKTASDYAHIVWAYGVIWSLFAIYGVMLWRRGQRLRADVQALHARLDAARRSA
jgi:hypothetical protein